MKVLGYILTAAVVLVGADVLVSSADTTSQALTTTARQEPMSLHGGTGMPTPPPEAY